MHKASNTHINLADSNSACTRLGYNQKYIRYILYYVSTYKIQTNNILFVLVYITNPTHLALLPTITYVFLYPRLYQAANVILTHLLCRVAHHASYDFLSCLLCCFTARPIFCFVINCYPSCALCCCTLCRIHKAHVPSFY